MVAADPTGYSTAVETLATLGGLGGLGGLIAGFASLRTSRQAKDSGDAIKTELRPNHGSSLRDKVDILADEVNLLAASLSGYHEAILARVTRQEDDIRELRRELHDLGTA